MTDVMTSSPPADPPSGSGHSRKVFVAVVVAILVILGVKLAFARWWRGGGGRRALTGLAEDGAVKLADALIDQVLPAA